MFNEYKEVMDEKLIGTHARNWRPRARISALLERSENRWFVMRKKLVVVGRRKRVEKGRKRLEDLKTNANLRHSAKP